MATARSSLETALQSGVPHVTLFLAAPSRAHHRYAQDMMQEGPAMGNQEYFVGIGIFFDTYSNVQQVGQAPIHACAASALGFTVMCMMFMCV